MSPICVAALGTITFLSVLLESVGLGAGPVAEVYAESPDNSGLIGASFSYRDTMLIVTTDDGVAAIVFQEKDPKLSMTSVKYRFRFLKNAESEEIMGAGTVLDTTSNKESLTIKAGAIRVGWSAGGHNLGHIYYQPEEMQISIASARRFDDIEKTDLTGPVSKLDLKRFLKKQK